MWVPARLNDRDGPLAEYLWFQDRPLTRAVTVTNDWTRFYIGQDSLAHAAEQSQDAFVARARVDQSPALMAFFFLTDVYVEPKTHFRPGAGKNDNVGHDILLVVMPSASRAREDCLLKPNSSVARPSQHFPVPVYPLSSLKSNRAANISSAVLQPC